EERLKIAIRAAHEKTRRTYGAKRLHQELLAEGFAIGRDRVARLRRELGIQCQQRRRFTNTTQSKHNYPVAPNLLAQQLVAQRPDTVWHADLTYIPTAEGWLYLAAIKDQCTCEIVGYAMGTSMTQELTIGALRNAISHRRPAPGLIHHADRGSQYCAKAYRAILQQQGLIASLSRRGMATITPPSRASGAV
ncbi:MAG: IS3 family transposase, partial [Acidithiobacillus sp.]|nr:IS3 family transposase [Acidithiobacillus sp.]